MPSQQTDDGVTPPQEPPPIIHVYSRRQQTDNTCPIPAYSPFDATTYDLDLSINLRKDFVSILKTVNEALNHLGCCKR